MDFGEEDNSYTSDEGRNGENIQLIPNDTVKRVVVRKPIPLVKRGGKMKDKMNRYISQLTSSLHESLNLNEDSVCKDALKVSFAAQFVAAAAEERNLVFTDLVNDVNPSDIKVHGKWPGMVLRHPYYRTTVKLALYVYLLSPMIMENLYAVDIVILFICLLECTLLWLEYNANFFLDKKWNGVFLGLTLVQVGMCICEILLPGQMEAIDLILRPFMLFCQSGQLSRSLDNIVRTFWGTRIVFFVGFVTFMFFAVLSLNMFNSNKVPGYSWDSDNFDSLLTSLLSYFVFLTTENFPMVADPSFTKRPWVAYPIFVSFVFVFYVLWLPLSLQSVLHGYAESHSTAVEKGSSKVRKGLMMAYFVMNDDDRGLPLKEFTALIEKPQDNKKSRKSKREVDTLKVNAFLGLEDFLNYSEGHNGGLWKRSFISNFEQDLSFSKPRVLQKLHEDVLLDTTLFDPYADIGAEEFSKLWKIHAVLMALLVMLWSPHHPQASYSSCTLHRGVICDFTFEKILHFCSGWVWLWIVELILIVLYVIQTVMWCVKHRIISFLIYKRNIGTVRQFLLVDIIISVASFVGHVSNFIIYGFLSSRGISLYECSAAIQFIVQLFDVFKAFRVLRLLWMFQATLHVLRALDCVVHVVWSITTLYIGVSYSFAAIGMALFRNNSISIDGLDTRYSFKTMKHAMLSMFFLTIGNNWNEMLYPMIVESGRWKSFWFLSYMFFCSLFMMDVLVGVVIEGFRVVYYIPKKGSPEEESPQTGRPENGSNPPRKHIGFEPSTWSPVAPEDMFQVGHYEGISESELKDLELTLHSVTGLLHTSQDGNPES
eukprot:349699_1